ncbi:unnamed protein product [Zymoseptoria tritici ST99CH_1E4]|uniref:Xylanolytic transcriptional activator regulatory domain-containing protein n=1 Tax=Zymoseptoria tritici ST99CH_1E4 TaxID=1276532 RepID=A0A2H1H0B8_ZYMTR|nr:unnamed protein product [Zymoseptoria tritici ST99CH_1E4]
MPFGNWGWNSNGTSNAGPAPYGGHPPTGLPGPHELLYGQQHSGVAPDQPYYQQPSNPTTSRPPYPPPYRQDTAHQQGWTPKQPESVSTASESIQRVFSPSSSEHHTQRALSPDNFLPYVRLFFQNMYSIMPVIDRNVYLDPVIYTNRPMSSELYAFMCALCAATIVQLDDSIPQPPPLHPGKPSDSLFAEECLRERKTFDYVDNMSPMSIMTSFFLFAYYGNYEKHTKAWHYLQESITFSENLEMDDEDSYAKLDPTEAQWRRRLYWLLFITERAYAVQRRKHTRLHASVTLPAVFESEDPRLLNGFVNLANLFSAVDDSFVSAWRGTRRASLCDETWLAQTQKQLDATADASGLADLTETQRLDIGVTREWLHVLAWQMGVSNGLIWGQGLGGMRLDYPVELARKVVEITANASPLALDSHGIGMEQKLSDIAGCLADVLKCTAGDPSTTFLEGKQHLQTLLHRLSSMRGKESRYLAPLLAKLDGVLGYGLNSVPLPLPRSEDEQRLQPAPAFKFDSPQEAGEMMASPRWSMSESVSMLRTLSMSGGLGMPGIAAAQVDYYQRRPSGRVLVDEDMEALQPWLSSAG